MKNGELTPMAFSMAFFGEIMMRYQMSSLARPLAAIGLQRTTCLPNKKI